MKELGMTGERKSEIEEWERDSEMKNVLRVR